MENKMDKEIKTFNRIELQKEYIDFCIECMDISDLAEIVADMMQEKLEELDNEEFIEEVNYYYPELLEND